MNKHEFKVLRESLIGCALADYFVKRALKTRIGAITFDLTEYIKNIGRERLSTELLERVQLTIDLVLGDALAKSTYDEEEKSFTFFFNEKIYIVNDFLYVDKTAFKIPEDLKEMWHIDRYITCTGMSEKNDPTTLDRSRLSNSTELLNNLDAWVTDLNVTPVFERPVYALIDSNASYGEPHVEVLKLVNNGGESNPPISWHLVEFDPDEQEELLQQNYNVVAWRYK
jgi:hypothetical protein